MPQLQNLVLTDRASPVVNHTFTPRDIVNGMGTVTETAGTPIGENRFQVALNKTTTGRYKAVIKLAVPIVQNATVNGISTPTVVRTGYVNMDFTFDPSSTEQERKDVVGMIQSALGADKVLVNDTVVKLQGVF